MTEDSTKDIDSEEDRWARLMRSAQAGDEADYRELLTELAHVVRRYLSSRFGRAEFVDDCVQDCLVAIHEARHSYDAGRKFRPWFFAIVRYKAIDVLRGQRRRRDLVTRQAHEQLSTEQILETNPLEAQIVSGYLLRALSPDYRDAIILTKLKGYSVTEAAAQLKISEGALKVRVHRGIGRLKRLVEAEKL
ncbi:sigma-70 family RNA polymerase sigma factor [Halieaceae bacterium IMCC14734]|uniref:Sigma-70 family RNA polymerase sigma factor n=1 Tax=Candidatus Litorirhabdus singularis TaxID=2518993 RepID=A0ABT3TH11_9GAMM|nr:sigma-70 family RNA polymerase sigma factor [Candidatus Litorirhabdus singularis]MCX2980714.1 sigma-70 family RNA polymerase sigma factor [Candidatus Litorirhabdus singularis]